MRCPQARSAAAAVTVPPKGTDGRSLNEGGETTLLSVHLPKSV